MGEMADYMLNGDDCEQCGDHLGKGPGHPRTCRECDPDNEDAPESYDFEKNPDEYVRVK